MKGEDSFLLGTSHVFWLTRNSLYIYRLLRVLGLNESLGEVKMARAQVGKPGGFGRLIGKNAKDGKDALVDL